MKLRTIKVTVTYDMESPDLKGLQINPKEECQKMVEKEMVEMFSWDEGYLGVEVEVIDE